ncbi:MAG TPA: hemolysin [Marinilabiliales bacterium]|jgi:CBS domain containing-hemolysin-like protein|nr:MAG: hemolysin [Bacteroidetes bacterium GWA2_40_14]OFX63124.1 MAG: hemolysin [Bacteroidetes bacterium GWC2_40_13]OFX75730.1 MAG: hemolysin [Bacteroidetes bacterium GWD2_40_43]OFX94997.1 MAG: hemolysin [Bacteroidetes bacterium GWE2_40_63]OFY23508.1 MAG: hemolysin [Bacteroidetes bacterium GWF2_40_13]OFZ29366.1 MAG: hemolysin [Bacteroidetes bacterium RIFOXYC2_FULL_40_12]HAM98601.1 hemolysin [Marinilabiliales bacterium]
MTPYLIILVTLVLSAFFSGMEIAFVSANKLRIELDKKQNLFHSGIINIFSENPSQYISTMLIGNNVVLVIYSMFMAVLLEPAIHSFTKSEGVILFLETLISTLIILVVGEFVPKTIFRINPNQTLRLFALPVFVFYLIFFPIARLTTGLSRLILRYLFRVKIDEENTPTFGKIDLDHLVSETQEEQLEAHELKHDVKIFQNALDFSDIRLRECVVPRTELEAVSIDESVEVLKQRFTETGYSKILVYQDSIDNIIGFAHCIDLFEKPQNIKSMVRKIPIVPETMPANKLLGLFIQNKKSMALVVDEFGGTAGIVTMEDILEEIVGDIQDEHDKVVLEETLLGSNEFRFSGRLEIDDLNEKYNLNFPVSDDYETIAGLILKHHGSIPKINDMVTIEQFNFKILKATNTKIELVHLKIH